MRIVDASRLTADEFDMALELRRTLDRLLDPDIDSTTAEELRLLFTADETEGADHDRVVAFDEERAIAIGHLERPRDPANPQLAVVMIDALDADLPDSGPVLARLLDLAEADGRSSIVAWGDLTEVQDTFWTSFGATRRQVDRDSDLRFADVDPGLMHEWVAAHHERADDIRIVSWTGDPPEDRLDALVEARNAMNDAPRDDIEMEDVVITAEDTLREAKALAALGWELHGMLAIDGDGSPAGLTTVLVNNHRPDASWQGDTVVLERHRRRGIGRWLKAAMWLHLREVVPHLARLRTGNAESNAAMLAINVEMGFRPAHSSAGWQTDISTMRAALAS